MEHANPNRTAAHAVAALVVGCSAMAAPAGAATEVAAGDYPNRPVRMVVPFTPRGTSDVVARIVAEKLESLLGQTVVVDNRPGAGGTLGTAIAAEAPPDGHTMLYAAKSLAINQSLYRKLPYHALRSFQPVSLVQSAPYVMVVSGKVPANSMQELIGMIRAQPGKLNYASGGTGTGPQMAMELLKLQLGLDIVHIPYKGSAPALRDVAAGAVQSQFVSVIAAMQFLGSGRLRPLAVSTAARARQLPNVPTMIESGIKDFDESGWSGILVPAATPRAIVERLNRDINAVLRDPEMVVRIRREGAEPTGSSIDAYRTRLAREIDTWADVVARTGLRAN